MLEPGLEGGSLAAVPLVDDDRHVLRPGSLAEELTRAVRRAVVDDDELRDIDRQLCGQRVVDRSLDSSLAR